MSFFSFKNQRTGGWNKSCLGGEGGTSTRGKDVGKVCGRVNIVQIPRIHVVNEKMRPVETTPGMGRR
jgi:hypothetical protein